MRKSIAMLLIVTMMVTMLSSFAFAAPAATADWFDQVVQNDLVQNLMGLSNWNKLQVATAMKALDDADVFVSTTMEAISASNYLTTRLSRNGVNLATAEAISREVRKSRRNIGSNIDDLILDLLNGGLNSGTTIGNTTVGKEIEDLRTRLLADSAVKEMNQNVNSKLNANYEDNPMEAKVNFVLDAMDIVIQHVNITSQVVDGKKVYTAAVSNGAGFASAMNQAAEKYFNVASVPAEEYKLVINAFVKEIDTYLNETDVFTQAQKDAIVTMFKVLKGEDVSLSDQNLITEFTLVTTDGAKYPGVIDQDAKTIVVRGVPADKDISSLKPEVKVSEYATIKPTTAQDFRNDVAYTVTAENSDERTYVVTVRKLAKVSATFVADADGSMKIEPPVGYNPARDELQIELVDISSDTFNGKLEILVPPGLTGTLNIRIKPAAKDAIKTNKPVNAIEITGLSGLKKVKIKITVPKGVNKAAGFHENKNNGRYEFREATVENGVATFETDLSMVLVAEEVAVPSVSTTKTHNSVTLSWSQPAGTTYEVFQGDTKLTAAPINASSYTVSGLSANTTYDFKVRAIDADNFESDYAEVSVTTNASSGSSGGSNSGGSSGGGTSTSTTTTIKATAGGTVTRDGLSIKFPANALSTDFTVKAEQLGRVAASRLALPERTKLVSGVFEITKDVKGDFDKAVSLTLEYDNDEVDLDKEEVSLYWLDEEDNVWVELDNIKVNEDKATVTGEVDHFTKFAVLATEKPEAPQPKPVAAFKDVAGHWAESYITALVEAGAISGYPDGTFKPNNNITRAEFATVLVKALDLEMAPGKVFQDTANHWAKDYIATAQANGILSGYDDTTFGANDLITREQMAVMITKAFNLVATEDVKVFNDADNASVWAANAIEVVSSNGIVSGYPDNTFGPKNNATRAEAVTVIVKALAQ
ncbi:S-layer homology domain-containing protein [Clostridium formicaceticum]|uniref:Cellulosome-anchoring protein n=1 Tax=Clostridium formicaceticum TaxID=1497 RepID=A0AAC9RIH1_9CLOT|nr:S-layer homology domain-containing protein [Clostridium formicaceticum]AOY75627.1 hypothetical protein BJL90_06805 [Clostridium formicaceticum]ARE85938.1 Cellulosome-anchoring protein precursor [Clostridium formicaceticum]